MGKAYRSRNAVIRRKIVNLEKLAAFLKQTKTPHSLREQQWLSLIWAIEIVKEQLTTNQEGEK